MLNKIRPYLYIISFCFSLLLMIYSSYIGIRNVFRYNVTKNELNVLYTELDNLKNKHAKLSNSLIFLQHPDYWELLSKRKLGYKKTGETMYMFMNNGDNQ